MSDAWNDIQALKHRRAKMMERRKQREGLAAELTSSGAAPSIVPTTTVTPTASDPSIAKTVAKPAAVASVPDKQQMKETVRLNIDPEVEKKMLMVLCDISLDIPSDSKVIAEHTSRLMEREVDLMLVEELLRRFAAQKLISIKFSEGVPGLTVDSLDLTKLSAIAKGQGQTKKRRRDSDEEEEEEQTSKQARPGSGPESGDIESLLSMQSTKEREEKKVNEEIQALLVTQTAKEQYLVEKFKSRGGPQLQEFCQYGTREECQRTGPEGANCKRLHFKKIIHKHTDESLGDCSFLNTCFHMDTCKDSSSMATSAGNNQQQVHAGPAPMEQPSEAAGWYYDYDNNTNIGGHYPGHRQGQPPRQPYQPPAPVASVTPANTSNPSSGVYPPPPISDTSNMTNRPFPPAQTAGRMDHGRSYANPDPNQNPNQNPGNLPPQDSNRIVNTNNSMPSSSHDMAARSFSTSNNPITTAETTQQQINMPVTHQHPHPLGDPRNVRNALPRSYPAVTRAETDTAPPPLLSEMPSTSGFQYSAIPYTLTAPPPAPVASAVPSAPFTHHNDMNMPPFDMAGPVISYSWSVAGDLLPTTINPAETKPPTKSSKPKTSSSAALASGRKRVSRPEMWKKNVTKKQKLSGEEHVSRTGNVIPAKQVEKIDCSQCSFKCHESFTEDLRQQLFDVFYSLGSNESQKQFVCQNVQEAATKLSGSNKKEEKAENKRKVCRKYFLPDTDNTRKQVCSKFFCGTLAIGKTFITHALRNKQFGCYVGKEKRGKPHNKIPEDLLQPARQHILSMISSSSGGSKKNSKKKCLERGLSITKMHEMYKQECFEKGLSPVSLSMYRRIFHTEF